MSKSCDGLLKELVECLRSSPCVQVDKKTISECVRVDKGLSTECLGIRATYFRCKRGQLDMRTRIRGNKGY